jgi:hypothetical protein
VQSHHYAPKTDLKWEISAALNILRVRLNIVASVP